MIHSNGVSRFVRSHPMQSYHRAAESLLEMCTSLVCRSLNVQLAKQPTVLIFADSDLFPHLVNCLGNSQYILYAASELDAAQAILLNVPIDLVLFHHRPERDYGGWEVYNHLRRFTTKPILWIPNITVEHFVADCTTERDDFYQADLDNYRKLVALLCRTLL